MYVNGTTNSVGVSLFLCPLRGVPLYVASNQLQMARALHLSALYLIKFSGEGSTIEILKCKKLMTKVYLVGMSIP